MQGLLLKFHFQSLNDLIRLLYIWTILSATYLSSVGQGVNHLKLLNDSLIHKLEIVEHDSAKAGIMLQLAENLMYSDPDSAIYYGERALELAEKEQFVHIQVGAKGFIGNTLKLAEIELLCLVGRCLKHAEPPQTFGSLFHNSRQADCQIRGQARQADKTSA